MPFSLFSFFQFDGHVNFILILVNALQDIRILPPFGLPFKHLQHWGKKRICNTLDQYGNGF